MRIEGLLCFLGSALRQQPEGQPPERRNLVADVCDRAWIETAGRYRKGGESTSLRAIVAVAI